MNAAYIGWAERAPPRAGRSAYHTPFDVLADADARIFRDPASGAPPHPTVAPTHVPTGHSHPPSQLSPQAPRAHAKR